MQCLGVNYTMKKPHFSIKKKNNNKINDNEQHKIFCTINKYKRKREKGENGTGQEMPYSILEWMRRVRGNKASCEAVTSTCRFRLLKTEKVQGCDENMKE